MSFSIPMIHYPKLVVNLFCQVFELDIKDVEFEECHLIISNDKFGGKEGDPVFIHWMESIVMIINEIQLVDEEIEEMGHCFIKAMIEDYDDNTLYPEQFLMKTYNQLKNESAEKAKV